MTTLETLKDRYAEVKDRIARAAGRAGRSPDGIRLVAVTKYTGAEEIRELMALGHADFGENHVQQLVQRAAMIGEWQARLRKSSGVPATNPADAPVRWHMIGHLQRNKARKACELCSLIHSVDSLRIAEEVQTFAYKSARPIDVLLQVNCSGEGQKYGCSLPAARHLAEQIEGMINVRLRGIMTIAAESDNPEDARPAFVKAREVFEEIAKTGVGGGLKAGEGHFNILSMGMSADFEVAISEGANLVRVGSAIFGPGTRGQADPRDED